MQALLVLVVIADVQVGPFNDRPAVRGLFARQAAEQGRLSDAVFPDQGNPVPPEQVERHMGKHFPPVKGLGQVPDPQHIVPGAPGGRKAEKDLLFLLRPVEDLNLVQHLHPALGPLDGLLPVEGPELPDHLQLPGDFLLLSVIRPLPRQPSLRPQVQIPGVVAGILFRHPEGELHDAGADPVHKIPVVGHHQHAAPVIAQIILQPAKGFQVQVVRRLVQEKDIGLLQQKPAQIEPCQLSPGKHGSLLVLHFFRKPQALEHPLDRRLPGITARVLKSAVQAGIALAQAAQLFFVRRFRHLMFHLAKLLLHLADRVKHLVQQAVHRHAGDRLILLGQIADFHLFGHRNTAAVRGQLSAQHAKQGRFPAAVDAHQPQSVAMLQGQRDVLEHSVSAERFGNMLCVQHYHPISSGIGFFV